MATNRGWVLSISFKIQELEHSIERQKEKVEESRALDPEVQRHEERVLRELEETRDAQKEKLAEFTAALRSQIWRIRDTNTCDFT